MKIQVAEVKEKDKIMIPAFTIDVGITGIYTDIKRTQVLKEQLKSIGYLHHDNEGHYSLLNVEETFRFYMGLCNSPVPLEKMLQIFGLQAERKTKVKDLSESTKNRLSFLRPFLYTKDVLIIEEPFDRLDDESRQIVVGLIKKMADEHKKFLLLSHNLEELLLVTEDIYRIDHSVFHKLDFNEEINLEASDEPIIKIEKIQTKHQDKTILFNPPEIDYIESIEGSVYVNVAGTGYSCSLTLQELEKRLRPYGFYRCHRSYIVNLQKVREIITWTKNSYSLKLNVEKGDVVPLSRTKLTELKELIGVL